MITVICSHFNEPHSLAKHLIPSLQMYGKHKAIELIVVDDGTYPMLLPKLKSTIGNKQWIKLAHSSPIPGIRHGVSRARNVGARMSTSEWLVFVDAHSSFSGDAYDRIKDAIRFYGPDTFICGRYVNHRFNSITEGSGGKFRFYTQNEKTHELADILHIDPISYNEFNRHVQAPIGANYVVHRNTFLAHNGYEGMVGWCQFEAFNAFKYWKLHNGVAVDNDIIINHHEELSGGRGAVCQTDLFFNKMFTLWMFMPSEVLMKWKMLLRSVVDGKVFNDAFRRLDTVAKRYSQHREYCQFTSHELQEYCDKWEIEHPLSL